MIPGWSQRRAQARQMAKWISYPRMSWVSAVNKMTRPFLKWQEDKGHQIFMPRTSRTQDNGNQPGPEQTKAKPLSLYVSKDSKGHGQHQAVTIFCRREVMDCLSWCLLDPVCHTGFLISGHDSQQPPPPKDSRTLNWMVT